MRRLFPPRPCEHPVSRLLAVRIPDQWHIDTLCQGCGERVLIPTGTVVAVAIRDGGIADPCDPQDVGGVAHVMEVMRESAG
jgi:hypothetical protein